MHESPQLDRSSPRRRREGRHHVPSDEPGRSTSEGLGQACRDGSLPSFSARTAFHLAEADLLCSSLSGRDPSTSRPVRPDGHFHAAHQDCRAGQRTSRQVHSARPISGPPQRLNETPSLERSTTSPAAPECERLHLLRHQPSLLQRAPSCRWSESKRFRPSNDASSRRPPSPACQASSKLILGRLAGSDVRHRQHAYAYRSRPFACFGEALAAIREEGLGQTSEPGSNEVFIG
jgi:hypothetical protein